MEKILYLLERLREPSTHSSLAAGFALVGANFPETEYGQLMQVLGFACMVLGIFFKEGKPENKG